MSIADKLSTVAEKMQGVYDAGYHAAQMKCGDHHYTASINGTDQRYIEIDLPFLPDIVTVYTTGPYANVTANTFRGMVVDMRSCSVIANLFYCNSSGSSTSGNLRATGRSCFDYNDSTFRFEMSATSLPNVLWRSNVRYSISAVRFTNEDSKSMVEEQIRSLPDTPQGNVVLEYSADRIAELFTDEEWAELIATKPKWSFSLI